MNKTALGWYGHPLCPACGFEGVTLDKNSYYCQARCCNVLEFADPRGDSQIIVYKNSKLPARGSEL